MIKAKSNHFESEKIKSIDFISTLNKEGKKLGLCHGGFDLLHPGHIKHLESAKQLCDLLVVSITSDRFNLKRKGKGRPIYTENLRAYTAAALDFVDYVIITDYERAVEVIEKIKPDFYIKGPDFINKNTPGIIAEREAVEKNGGKLQFTKDEKFSTTELIEHIRNLDPREKLLLILDRDGTLIENVHYLGKDENWKDQIKINKKIIDAALYLSTKFDVTPIVVSNQLGVAKGLFTNERVDEINSHIGKELEELGLIIKNWKYCPQVDKAHADSSNEKFLQEYIKEKSCRKPSENMVLNALEELNKTLNDFDKLIVFGDKDDDMLLAKNLNCKFIDANKDYDQIKNELD